MKRIAIIILAVLGIGTVYFGGNVLAEMSEKQAVRIPLENYLKGHETGQAEFMEKAFHTEGKLMFIRDGKYTTRDFKDYIGGMSGTAAKDEADRKRKIESIDISGNAAVGKIVLDYPKVRFVDYMTLLKIDGEWKIVNKAFFAEPKSD
ncbi:MAG: nuclear transport factor 2 family protein [Pyrinomonadaceae bacterium]